MIIMKWFLQVNSGWDIEEKITLAEHEEIMNFVRERFAVEKELNKRKV